MIFREQHCRKKLRENQMYNVPYFAYNVYLFLMCLSYISGMCETFSLSKTCRMDRPTIIKESD